MQGIAIKGSYIWTDSASGLQCGNSETLWGFNPSGGQVTTIVVRHYKEFIVVMYHCKDHIEVYYIHFNQKAKYHPMPR